MYAGFRGIAIGTVAAVLILAPALWAQQNDEIAPFSLTGNVGVGYSNVKDYSFSQSTPAASVDADMSGYWKDPRILGFNLSPYAGYGNGVANGIDVGNRGDGFYSSATFLGGSHVPVSVSYSRQWEDYPGYSNNANVFGSFSTSLASSALGIDTGVYLGKLPPIDIHYGRGSFQTSYSGLSGEASNTYNTFSAGTGYTLLGWALAGTYGLNNSEGRSVNLLDPTASFQPQSADSSNLLLQAQERSRWHSVTIVGGERSWSNETSESNTNTSYYYYNINGNFHPTRWFNAGLLLGWNSDEAATQIQQLLGVQGGQAALPGLLTTQNTAMTNVGGNAQLLLPKGFTLNGDATFGQFSGSNGTNGKTILTDVFLDYVHRMHRSGTWMASGGYQHSENTGDIQQNWTSAKVLRGSYSNMLPQRVSFTGSMNYTQRDIESYYTGAKRVDSPGHTYGIMLNGSRPLTDRIKVTAGLDYNYSLTEYPFRYESKDKGFSMGVESRELQVSLHRHYQQGLATQVGNGLVFVTDPQQAQLSPLASMLSMNSNTQTTLMGTYQPGRKRLKITASWLAYGYDNQGRHVSDANLFNLVATYNLRLLKVKAGFYQMGTQAYGSSNLSSFQRRQIYFEVIRHFRLF